jgi:hypothetical protein
MKTVWVLAFVDYDYSGVDGVFYDLQVAVDAVKMRYRPPYVVSWDGPIFDEDYEERPRWTLTGHFESVLGHSSQHTAVWEVTEWPVL